VIGTLVTRGQGGFGNDQDDVVLMPIKTVQRRFTGNRDVRTIMVQVDAAYDTAAVTASIQALLARTTQHHGREARQLQHLRHRPDCRDTSRHDEDPDRAAWRGGGRQPARRWYRDHEHHAGLGD
jgi:hypothetical protein